MEEEKEEIERTKARSEGRKKKRERTCKSEKWSRKRTECGKARNGEGRKRTVRTHKSEKWGGGRKKE